MVNGTFQFCKFRNSTDFFNFIQFLFTDKGEVFGWGNSEYGQLGARDDGQQMSVPVNLKMPRECGKIVDIAVGGSSCIVLNGIFY